MEREVKFLWMRELLEHVGQCYDQWAMADQPHTRRFLSGALERDLAEFRQLCQGDEHGFASPNRPR